jgi:hypothetical protein
VKCKTIEDAAEYVAAMTRAERVRLLLALLLSKDAEILERVARPIARLIERKEKDQCRTKTMKPTGDKKRTTSTGKRPAMSLCQKTHGNAGWPTCISASKKAV